ncbi:hypothetical protein Enr13x_76300 [Stieleria neptunia]|uniref:DUF3352 domain-containing protein n=1 Tax=Stieleria neptunia TaxID=2527979 RepID=A0A518I3P0_9BACT|nr:hypothetical protein [Stieleria neptunia]QDV47719.1 hypothetical protein Enr13x_76300 [Stieleria neptunia]
MTFPALSPARRSHGALAAFAFSVFLASPSIGQDTNQGDRRTAAELLPASVVAYAEVARLGDVIELVTEHPLRQQIQDMPAVRAIGGSDQVRPLRDGIAAFEGGMGRPWDEALSVLTDGGIHLAFDAPTQGAALLIKSSSREQLERFRGVVLAIAQLGQGEFGIARQADYRGFTAYSLNDNIKLALVDQWFLMTNKPELGKSIIDRYVDGDKHSLAASDSFTTAMARAGDASLKAYVDVETIRSAGVAPKLYAGKTENVAAEALFGGIVANLAHTPSAVATLQIHRSGVRLALATAHQSEWESGREYFFGEDSGASAPPLLQVPDRLLAISTHRDLSQMWLHAPDLMTDKANEDLAQADTNLTTFFSGRDFGEDILGSLLPGIQVVVQRQTFDAASPQPAIKLPAFAMQFQMRTPEETTREFRRVFQNVVGFINVVGAMQGQPQLDLDFEQADSATLVTATYVPPRDEDELAAVPINYNFSPTIAFAGERMIVSSSTPLARTLTGLSAPSESKVKHPNTVAVLHADALADTLRDNKQQLVAQNMLEKGHGPDQANAEIDVLFGLLALFKEVTVELDVDEGQLKLTTDVQLQSK